MKQNNLNYDKNILEFLTVAMEFCVTLENAIQYSQKDFIGKITKIMPLLYLKADLMPDSILTVFLGLRSSLRKKIMIL